MKIKKEFRLLPVIDYYKIDTLELARVLFPDLKYPKNALYRILRGQAKLSADGIIALSNYLNVSVQDLFSVSELTITSDKGVLTFCSCEYEAKVNFKHSFVSFFKDGQFIENKTVDLSKMSVLKFIDLLLTIISEYNLKNA